MKKQDFKLSTPDSSGKAVAERDGNKYNVYINKKQYSSLDYDDDKAEGDLIWRYIFEGFKDASSYAIVAEPGEKKINSTGYIFVKSSFN